jgi:hypothetical protein
LKNQVYSTKLFNNNIKKNTRLFTLLLVLVPVPRLFNVLSACEEPLNSDNGGRGGGMASVLG